MQPAKAQDNNAAMQDCEKTKDDLSQIKTLIQPLGTPKQRDKVQNALDQIQSIKSPTEVIYPGGEHYDYDTGTLQPDYLDDFDSNYFSPLVNSLKDLGITIPDNFPND